MALKKNYMLYNNNDFFKNEEKYQVEKNSSHTSLNQTKELLEEKNSPDISVMQKKNRLLKKMLFQFKKNFSEL